MQEANLNCKIDKQKQLRFYPSTFSGAGKTPEVSAL